MILKPLFTMLAMVFAATLPGAGGMTLAQDDPPAETATIEVHARICDEVPADSDWFNTCHENASPDTPIALFNTEAEEAIEGTTGPDGNFVSEVSAGTWSIAGPPGDALEATFIYCSSADAGPDDLGHPVTVAAGDSVVCDFYFVPADLRGVMDVSVNVNLCVAPGCTELPEAIEPAEGVSLALSSAADDNVFGTCTTVNGFCIVEEVPEVNEVSVYVEPETIPEGYFVEPNPSVYQLAAGPEIWLLLYPVEGFPPDDGATPEPAPTLPPGDDAMPLPEPLALQLPAWLYGGTCADLEAMASSTFSEPLNDVTIVEGEQRGSPDALVAASGYSEVAVPLDEVLSGGYAVFVTDGQDLIACGDIGGPVDQAGTLSIGLAPVEDSGAAGVAYIAAQGDAQTGISIFLVPEGLVPTPDAGTDQDIDIAPDSTPVG